MRCDATRKFTIAAMITRISNSHNSGLILRTLPPGGQRPNSGVQRFIKTRLLIFKGCVDKAQITEVIEEFARAISHEGASDRRPAARASWRVACSAAWSQAARGRGVPEWREDRPPLRACGCRRHGAECEDEHRARALWRRRSF